MTYLFSNTSSIFQSNGSAITTVNPLPVTLGSANINIIGNITVPTVVNVASSPDNPVHTHITEVGTSGNLLANNISYMPIGGNVIVSSGNIDANVHGNVGILGNVNVTQGTDPWNITGNVGITGSVSTTFPAGATDLFGELYAIPITPTVQLDALHGIDPFETQTYTGGGGNVSVANGIFECSSTSTVGETSMPPTVIIMLIASTGE